MKKEHKILAQWAEPKIEEMTYFSIYRKWKKLRQFTEEELETVKLQMQIQEEESLREMQWEATQRELNSYKMNEPIKDMLLSIVAHCSDKLYYRAQMNVLKKPRIISPSMTGAKQAYNKGVSDLVTQLQEAIKSIPNI